MSERWRTNKRTKRPFRLGEAKVFGRETTEGLQITGLDIPRDVKRTKPYIKRIIIKKETDDDPELSYLGRYTSEPPANILPERDGVPGTIGGKYHDEYVIDRGENTPRDEYRYFVATNVENAQQAHENYDRYHQYELGNVVDYGISATAEVYIPDGRGNFTIQKIRSGGIWGISSDSDASEFDSEEAGQISDLEGQLKALNPKFSVKGVPVEKKEDE